MRALLARRRLEVADGSYRLLDPRPLEPGEREAIPRAPRRRKPSAERARRPRDTGRATYSEVGRVAIDRLIDLGREVGALRANVRTAREEAREAREARDEAERRSQGLAARVRDLEAKLEMAETNLRTLLAASRGAARTDAIPDAERDALLRWLQSPADAAPDPSPS